MLQLKRMINTTFDREYRKRLNNNWDEIEKQTSHLSDTVSEQIKKQDQRLDKIVSGVTTDTEVIDGRIDLEGEYHENIKKRMDSDAMKRKLISSEVEEIKRNIGYERVSYMKYGGSCLTFTKDGVLTNQLDMALTNFKNDNCAMQLVGLVYVNDSKDSDPIVPGNYYDSLEKILSKSKEKKVKIEVYKPHIASYSQGDGFSRASYLPFNTEVFFQNWKEFLLKQAKFCYENQIPILSVACEMRSLTEQQYVRKWEEIVLSIKEVYPSLKLVMAMSFSEFARSVVSKRLNQESVLEFLDYLGFTFYPQLPKANPRKGLFNQKDGMNYFDIVNESTRLFQKKYIVLETGSTHKENKGDYLDPINIDGDNNYEQQAIWINTVLNSFRNANECDGVFIWHWAAPFDYNGTDSHPIINQFFRTVKELNENGTSN